MGARADGAALKPRQPGHAPRGAPCRALKASQLIGMKVRNRDGRSIGYDEGRMKDLNADNWVTEVRRNLGSRPAAAPAAANAR